MADLAQPDVDVLWFVAQGFMPNPLEHARGVCQADPDHVEVEFIPATEPTSPASSGGYILAPSFVMLQGAGWSRENKREDKFGHNGNCFGDSSVTVRTH